VSTIAAAPSRVGTTLTEARKLAAFARRDFLIAWSYRMSFVSDLFGLVGAALVFYFIGTMVDPEKLPTYGGTEVTYLDFAAVGISIGIFMQFGLERLGRAVRAEQLMGTLESVLITPTRASTIQFGSVAFDLVYIPLRTAVYLVALVLTFGLHFHGDGIPVAAGVLLAFLPFVWGLGVISAAATLTFRRGSGIIGLGTLMLALISGLYFPIDLLPHWLSSVARLNPIALASNGMRDALLGNATWADVAPTLLGLVGLSVLTLTLGVVAFRLALRRERRNGTLGLY
jgi:ABC-2 type transport system permease protein